jgi:peptidoglycan/xylan/chitin deacetylase (PgdA/CDA1 family)
MPVILNFHGVGKAGRPIGPEEHNCWLDQDFFHAVLDLIAEHPNVRITVDDGNASDFGIVFPALQKRGLRADFFICSGRLNQPDFLNQMQVRELRRNGMGIGSHGIKHVSWRGLSPAGLAEELRISRAVLEQVCEYPVDTAACPFGAYDREVLQGLQEAGYRQVYTSDGGACIDDHWLQARTTINRSTGLVQIQRLIRQENAIPKQLMISARKLIKRFR